MRRHLLDWVAMGAIGWVFVIEPRAEAAPNKKKPPVAESPPSFDRQAAVDALVGITDGGLTKCKTTNAPKGDGHVRITFSPSGTAQNAVIDKGPWIGTPVAKCMQKEFKKARVPSFGGEAVTVGKSFHFE